MKDKRKIIGISCIVALWIIVFAVYYIFWSGTFYKPNIVATDTVDLYVGDVPISKYVIVADLYNETGKASKVLKQYIYNMTGEKLSVYPASLSKRRLEVRMADSRHPAGIVINNGIITITGSTFDEITHYIEVFANSYMEWSYAGQEREHILDNDGVCVIPANVSEIKDGLWIPEREPIITLWKADVPRGQWENKDANLNSEIMLYTDDQLYDYIKMMKHCGFTGVQVTDMCATWGQYGEYEFVQDRIRFMADAAHSMDMNFTLWVWGAEFTGYGWIDTSVIYSDYTKYQYSYECPEAIDTFNKYYSIYAQLADCSDRVIMHFDDPSNIHTSEEVAYYAKMFHDMVKEINPDIKFGISDYTNKFNKYILADSFDDELMILGGAKKSKSDSWNDFRFQTVDAGCTPGVWCWDLSGREIDQLSGMYVNNTLIKQVYLNSREDADAVGVPTYWSEMDAYHLMNVYSLYACGHLLQSPDQDENSLLYESAVATVGSENADDYLKVLEVIRDARTGGCWEEYNWSYDTYILRSDDYPAEDILNRTNEAISILDDLIGKDIKCNSMPFPISITEYLQMVRTQVVQINEYAEFRVGLNEIKTALSAGEDKASLEKKLNDIYSPISNYDSVVGVWGQIEALAQYAVLTKFCSQSGLAMPDTSEYLDKIEEYVYSEMVSYQKTRNYQMLHGCGNLNCWDIVVGQEAYDQVCDRLIQKGLIAVDEDGWKYLTNWEDIMAK